MTVHQAGNLVLEHYSRRLNFYERNLLKKLMDGVDGLGDISDNEIKDYLSEPQINFIKKLALKFRIIN